MRQTMKCQLKGKQIFFVLYHLDYSSKCLLEQMNLTEANNILTWVLLLLVSTISILWQFREKSTMFLSLDICKNLYRIHKATPEKNRGLIPSPILKSRARLKPKANKFDSKVIRLVKETGRRYCNLESSNSSFDTVL